MVKSVLVFLLFLDEKKQKSTDSTESMAKISYNGENLSIPPQPLKDLLSPIRYFLTPIL